MLVQFPARNIFLSEHGEYMSMHSPWTLEASCKVEQAPPETTVNRGSVDHCFETANCNCETWARSWMCPWMTRRGAVRVLTLAESPLFPQILNQYMRTQSEVI